MDKQDQEKYLANYKKAKEKGESFFPDALFKDALISLLVFGLLVALAYFLGAPLEDRADPADTNYTPRPEWYFLFLFQLLKYFPGKLEVIGVVLLPTIVIILLLVLPFLDRSSKRHFSQRPLVIGVTGLFLAGIIYLTYLSIEEAPPPAQAAGGDQVASLYAANCAPCHGGSIPVAPGTNLHNVIAQGKHTNMPAWSGDLSSDQIDALAGFILSPAGSQLFADNCGSCHQVDGLVAGDPIALKAAIDDGSNFQPHQSAGTVDWSATLDQASRTLLINFLNAPDGRRLFEINCSGCHGSAVVFSGSEETLRQIIRQGGMHLDMPAWKEKLSPADLDLLAQYVFQPAAAPEGRKAFEEYCASCHGDRIPRADSIFEARAVIESGGNHQVMPVWGDVLTPEQLDALVVYSAQTAKGTSLQAGQDMFAQYCAPCHGEFGEGGPNPARAGDIIAPISTSEYLETRDDYTLQKVISEGQPNFGMSPFETANGGPLDSAAISAIVAYLRSWEANPPVELPPEFASPAPGLEPGQVFVDLCAQCHGPAGEGGLGPSFQSSEFQQNRTDQQIFDTINLGHPSTAMIGWGEILPSSQIEELVKLIRGFRETGSLSTTPSFSADILPIFEKDCNLCHGEMGGWNGSTADSAVNSGDHSPVIIPGDPDGSFLMQKILGAQTIGGIMPPITKLTDQEIALIRQWIADGAKND